METSKWATLWAVPAVGLFVLINLFKVHSISQQKKWELPSTRQIPRINIEQSPPLISCSDQQIAFVDPEGSVWRYRINYSIEKFQEFGRENVPQKISALPKIQSVAVAAVNDIDCLSPSHSLFLDVEGNVWGSGNDSWDQLRLRHWSFERASHDPLQCFREKIDEEEISNFILPRQLKELPKIKAISANGSFSLFLDVEGNVYGTGCDRYGQIGPTNLKTVLGWKLSVSQMVPLNLPPIQAISTGWYHSLFLDIYGNVWACGRNDCGQLGLGVTDAHSEIPSWIQGLPVVRSIHAGTKTSAFVDANGVVWICGKNNCVQVILSSDCTPKRTNLPEAINIAFGRRHALLLDVEGTVWSWGENSDGQLGRNGFRNSFEAAPITDLPRIQAIGCAADYSVFVDVCGDVWICGLTTGKRFATKVGDLEKPKWGLPPMGNPLVSTKSARNC